MKMPTLALLTLFAIAGCEAATGSPEAAPATPIASADSFNRLIVGKALSAGDMTLTINANGTITGQYGAESTPVSGVWEWKDGQYCPTLTSLDIPYECSAASISGNAVTFRRDDGLSLTYSIL